MQHVLRRAWNIIIMWLLWPLWWPLSGLYLLLSATNSAANSETIGHRVKTAGWIFQVWLGWKDFH